MIQQSIRHNNTDATTPAVIPTVNDGGSRISIFLELLSFMENYSTSQQQPMEQQQQEHQHKSQLKWDLDTVINIAKMFDIVSFHDLLMYYSIDKIDNLFSRENKLYHCYNE